MNIKYCNTCRLSNKNKQVCLLTGLPVNLNTDYCSKHVDEPTLCDICGVPMVTPGFIEEDPEGNWHTHCERCQQLYNTCQLCPKFQKCEFMTNPDPMPKVVMKTVRQGNMVMQTQVKNDARVQKFCPSCECWDENHGCMKEFNSGCINQDKIFTSRES